MSGLHPESHALTLFRVLPNGEGRAYTAVTFPRDPFAGCERTIRQARACGFIATDADYGVLDVLNEQGDIVADYAVTARGFRWLKRRLGLVVAASGEDE
jgi:hypothetical protein